GRGGAGEGQLAHTVHGEREIALHHEGADQPAHQAQHGTRDQGVGQQCQQLTVVLEGEDVAPVDQRVHARPPEVMVLVVIGSSPSSSWCVSASGTPTTTSRPPARNTNTGVPYSRL